MAGRRHLCGISAAGALTIALRLAKGGRTRRSCSCGDRGDATSRPGCFREHTVGSGLPRDPHARGARARQAALPMSALPTVFDIESIPEDIAGIRPSADLRPARVTTKSGFGPSQQLARKTAPISAARITCSVCAISCVLREARTEIAVWTLGEESDDEPTIIQKFFDLVEKRTPQLVSWNGGGFVCRC